MKFGIVNKTQKKGKYCFMRTTFGSNKKWFYDNEQNNKKKGITNHHMQMHHKMVCWITKTKITTVKENLLKTKNT